MDEDSRELSDLNCRKEAVERVLVRNNVGHSLSEVGAVIMTPYQHSSSLDERPSYHALWFLSMVATSLISIRPHWPTNGLPFDISIEGRAWYGRANPCQLQTPRFQMAGWSDEPEMCSIHTTAIHNAYSGSRCVIPTSIGRIFDHVFMWSWPAIRIICSCGKVCGKIPLRLNRPHIWHIGSNNFINHAANAGMTTGNYQNLWSLPRRNRRHCG